MSTYTIAGNFRPDLGSAVDSINVSAYSLSGWALRSPTHTPPRLGDGLPSGSPDAYIDLSNHTLYPPGYFGDYGAWELALNSNEDYYIAVEYSSTYYWQLYYAPAWTTGQTSELDVDNLYAGTSVYFGSSPAIELSGLNADANPPGYTLPVGIENPTTGSSAYLASGSNTGGSVNLAAYIDHVHAGLGQPIGVDSATKAVQFVGGTDGGPPSGGTYTAVKGDFVVDQSGGVYVYNGSTWVPILPAAYAGATGDIKAFAGLTYPTPPTGWLACDGTGYTNSAQLGLFNVLTTALTMGYTSLGMKEVTVASTAALQVGWPVAGNGLAAGSFVTEIANSTQFYVSQDATASAGPETLTAAPWGIAYSTGPIWTFNVPDLRGTTLLGASLGTTAIATTGTFANMSTTVTLPSSGWPGISRIVPGMWVTGAGIAVQTQVQAVLSATTIELTVASTSAETNTALTFWLPLGVAGGEGSHLLGYAESGVPAHGHGNSGYQSAAHAHNFWTGTESAAHNHNQSGGGQTGGIGGQNGVDWNPLVLGYGYNYQTNYENQLHQHNGTTDSDETDGYYHYHTVGNNTATAATNPHNNGQPWAGVNYIIKT